MNEVILPPESNSKAYALLFGVEKYYEAGLDDVRYAEKDASAVRDALIAIGYLSDNVQLTLSSAATKTSIEYEVRQLAKCAQKGDTVFFFFAGHGYTLGGQNFLLAYDTRRDDIEATSVSLGYVFGHFDQSECRQIMFFLDCCHSGMRLVDGARGVLESMSQEELRKHFAKAEFRVVFSACDKDEKSWPSLKFQHGYWTYHLLQALTGEQQNLLDENGRLLSNQLQDYLSVEVPAQLALQSTEKRRQNPKMYGDASGTFVIADLSILLAKLEAERKLQAVGLKHSTLRAIHEGSVKELSGFNKAMGHSVPKFYSATTSNWVAKIAQADLKEEIEEYFQDVRRTKIYSSKNLEYDPPTGGCAAIRTPDFEFTVSFSQKEDTPSEYEVTRELTRLNNPEILEEDWFNNVFQGVFDEAVFEFASRIKVTEFIARAEQIAAFNVSYDGGRTFCTITTNGFDGRITVTADFLKYEFDNADTPREMALQLQVAHALLLGTPEMQKALPI
jgi:hypothetical protein